MDCNPVIGQAEQELRARLFLNKDIKIPKISDVKTKDSNSYVSLKQNLPLDKDSKIIGIQKEDPNKLVGRDKNNNLFIIDKKNLSGFQRALLEETK